MKEKRETFAAWFRRTHGRPLTERDLRQILEEQFGIKPDANGYYPHSQFEPLWRQMEKPQ
jgi:hypothetical protein